MALCHKDNFELRPLECREQMQKAAFCESLYLPQGEVVADPSRANRGRKSLSRDFHQLGRVASYTGNETRWQRTDSPEINRVHTATCEPNAQNSEKNGSSSSQGLGEIGRGWNRNYMAWWRCPSNYHGHHVTICKCIKSTHFYALNLQLYVNHISIKLKEKEQKHCIKNNPRSHQIWVLLLIIHLSYT